MLPKIEINELHIFTPHRSLLELNEWKAYPGEVHAIIGESGSGKSLILKQLMGFTPNNLNVNGTIDFNLNAEKIHIQAEKSFPWNRIRGKNIGMVFQEPLTALNPQMTCGKQLMEAWNIHAYKSAKHDWKTILERLKDVGLEKEAQRIIESYPHQLSGGQRQRVVIAMATLHQPEIILADEPTTALDFFSREKVLLDLLNVVKKYQSTLIWVTHELEVVSKYADRVTVLRQGKLIQSGTTQEVLVEKPHEYVSELLEGIPAMQNKIDDSVQPVLSIRDLNKIYPNKTRALNQINIDIHPGQTLAIIGTSGSGKSTLAKILVALEKPSSGNILFEGKKLAEFPPTGIQMVFQDPYGSLNKKQTAFETLCEIRSVVFPKETKIFREKRVEEGLLEVSLDQELWNKRPTEMSGGQRQRLGIAKALATNPKALILDEAVAALDPLVKKQILKLLQKIQVDRQLMYIFITHDLPVAASIAHHIIYLKDGKQEEIPEQWNELLQNGYTH